MSSETNGQKDRLFETGSLIDDKWVLLERIGKGGMGEVFRAHQLNLKRDVAIKVISEEMLLSFEDTPEEIENAMNRLRIEIQSMARVRHPNVLQIYDYGTVEVLRKGKAEPIQYIVMEYIPGNTFRYTMSEEGFDDEIKMIADWLVSDFLPVLDGLEAIHGNDIVHRDIKPENILMDDDTPKIADFGLARSHKLKAVSNSWDVRGTMPYMAPEQFANFRRASFPADIYSMGKILFEAINGKMDTDTIPFKTASLENTETPFLASLDTIMRKATDENPQKRYQTVSELRKDILNAIKTSRLEEKGREPEEQKPPAYVRWLWAGIIAVLIAVGGMTIYHLTDTGPEKAVIASRQVSGEKRAKWPPAEKLLPTHMAPDGRRMELVKNAENKPQFYADTSPVTLHHYVEFLNEVRESLNVGEGVVRYDDRIWIYFGNGDSESGKIVYRHSRFHLMKVESASRPVTRVTWYGAKAYAKHYGKDLPEYEQWLLLDNRFFNFEEPEKTGTKSNGTAEGMHGHMREMLESVSEKEPDGAGKEQGIVKEWLDADKESSTTRPIAVPAKDRSEKTVITRQAWEGLSDVGFRTILYIRRDNSR